MKNLFCLLAAAALLCGCNNNSEKVATLERHVFVLETQVDTLKTELATVQARQASDWASAQKNFQPNLDERLWVRSNLTELLQIEDMRRILAEHQTGLDSRNGLPIRK